MDNLKRRRKRGIVKAYIRGGPGYNNIRGIVKFIPYKNGTIVFVKVSGLPPYTPAQNTAPPIGPFGFHIHQNGTCIVGDPCNPFEAAGGHWNPDDQPHGNHAGDLPVLFSNNGTAIMGVYTNKFRPKEVVNRSILIHLNPDDYRTQPAGASGIRIACGVIRRYSNRKNSWCCKKC